MQAAQRVGCVHVDALCFCRGQGSQGSYEPSPRARSAVGRALCYSAVALSSNSIFTEVLSHLFIFCVPGSIKNPGQNRMFYKQALLKVDSITRGEGLYPCFFAINVLSSCFFFN